MSPSTPLRRAQFGEGTRGEVDARGDCVLWSELIDRPGRNLRRRNIKGALGQSPLPGSVRGVDGVLARSRSFMFLVREGR